MPTPGHSQELQTPSPINPEVKQDKNALEEVKKRIQEVIAQLPELQKLKGQVLLEVTPEGLRIELLERENSTFFDIGSADLKSETKKILGHIAQELGRLPNQLAIEGHTDSRPYGKTNYSNWELSADRANAARRELVAGGMSEDKIGRVVGLASSVLFDKENPLNPINRRISLIIMNKQAEKAISQSEGSTSSEEGPSPSPPTEARKTTTEHAPSSD